MTHVLNVSHLTKKYGRQIVVNDISFTLKSGQCIALIGPDGAGKTTTLRMITGLIKPSSGTINYSNINQSDDFRSVVGYLPQYPIFHDWMTGKEYLIYCAKLSYINKTEAQKRAKQLLDRVGIADAQNKRIHTYSGGMKQRLGIAQAMIHQPQLLILDEPVSALDPIGRREVLTLMEELKEETTILFSTHILSDADEISDELLLLHHGDMIESGSMEHLRKKYQTTTIELTFEHDLEKYLEKTKQLTTITAGHIQRETIHATVTDIHEARKEILTIVAKENWPLTQFSINKASLEDMFMKAVNS